MLGLTWNRDLSGKKNAEMLAERFNTKLNTVIRVPKYLTKDRKITLVEGILISQIRCGIEKTTGGNDRENTTMQRLQISVWMEKKELEPNKSTSTIKLVK